MLPPANVGSEDEALYSGFVGSLTSTTATVSGMPGLPALRAIRNVLPLDELYIANSLMAPKERANREPSSGSPGWPIGTTHELAPMFAALSPSVNDGLPTTPTL